MDGKEWFTAVELAGLPGLPATERWVRGKADREAWKSRTRQGRGGGREYHISSLPAETQRALAIRNTNAILAASPAARMGQAEGARLRLEAEAAKQIAQEKRLASLAKAEGLQGMARDRMNAKLEIIKLWEVFRGNCPETTTAAQYLFCSAYNRGEIQAADWVRKVIAKTSQPSLLKWIKKNRQEGVTALAGKYGNRRGTGVIAVNRDLYNLVVSMLFEFPHCNYEQIRKAIVARQPELGLESVPSAKTVERFVKTWKNENKQLFANIQSPDGWRNACAAAFGDAAASVDRYLQCWEMDSTPTDVMLKDGRHTIIGVIDIHSRRAKMLVSKTSNAAAVCALVRRAMIAWGVPEIIKTDNGSDYTSKYMVEVLAALEIEQKICPPFSPERKPFIESFFGTFNHGLLELCPGFIGHSVADRKRIENRKSFAQRHSDGAPPIELLIDSAQLQKFCDDWADGIYFSSPHDGLKGKSPADMVKAWFDAGNTVRRIPDERVLDYLLAEAPDGGTRVVRKKGIEVDRFFYIAPELACYIGETVYVRHDPFDAGRIMVFKECLRDYICTAVRPELVGLDRAEIASVAKNTQKKLVSEKKRELRKVAGAAGLKNISGEILEKFVETAPARSEKDGASVEHNTDALQAVADAMVVSQAMTAEPETFEEINAASGVLSEKEEKKLAEVISLDTWRQGEPDREEREKKARIARYEALAAQGFQGISEEDDRWRRSWERESEYSAYKIIKKLMEENRQAIGAA